MILLPAIDLYEKKVVRLVKGDYEQMTVYSRNPVEQAIRFEKDGARWLHVVDLEGAKDGTTPNFEVVGQILQATGLMVEIGGGIRSMETLKRYLDMGVHRVILGTKAVTDPEFLQMAVEVYGERIAVGVDVKEGAIAIQGWKQTVHKSLPEFFNQLTEIGVKTVICTDISKDGMLGGANVELYQDILRHTSLQVIASGGISSQEDLNRLDSLGLCGAILGKALYSGALNLEKAIQLFPQTNS